MANAIETKKLTKVFGDRKALDKVSIEVPEGAFLSIFGPNGAGKTTLVRTLATLSRATSGTALVAGFDAKEEPDKVREHIGLISHNPMLYPDLTAMENLMFTAQLYGVVNAEERVRELLRAVELDHRRFDVVRTFSRGMTQRLSIARALAKRPEVIVFDDSFSALDYKTDARLREALAQNEKDAALVVVAQRIATIMRADQIIVLDEGRVVGQGTHEELLRSCPAYLEIAQSQLSAEELGLTQEEIAAVTEGGER